MGQVDGGSLSRSNVVMGFSESLEHQTLSAADVGGETADTFGIRFVG